MLVGGGERVVTLTCLANFSCQHTASCTLCAGHQGPSVWFHNPGDGHSQVLVLAAGPAGGWSSVMKPRVVSSGAGVCSRAANKPSRSLKGFLFGESSCYLFHI